MKKLFIYIILAVIACKVSPQTTGDEDKEMLNKGKERDHKEIDDAKQGWWAASMRNHDPLKVDFTRNSEIRNSEEN